jgi:outer membrane protein assembly factor BamB
MLGLTSSVQTVEGPSRFDRTLRDGATVPRCALLAAALLAGLLSGLLAGPLAKSAYGEPAWTTYHRDAARSGADPDAINPITPTFSWQSLNLGAPIWGQPLVLGSRVYVATVGDEIYALEASTGKVIWERSAGTPVPSGEVTCGDIKPTVGIVGTPVIDVSTNTLYAVADTWDASTKEARHVLQGYNLTSGENVLSTQVDPPGANPKTLLERPALNLDQGKVVFGFGGNAGDCGQYRGAVVAAPEAGGAPSFWLYPPAPPAYGGGAVWGTSGPAVDGEGHIYVSTGNPNFPKGQEVGTYDYSDSVVELSSSMSLIGNFEPESWLTDSNNDRDLGSSGSELLPGGLLFQAGKNEMGYLIDEATMGSGAPAVYSQKVCKGKVEGEGEGSFGGDAYAAGTIYVPCTDGVRALTYDQTARTFAPLWHGPSDATGPPIVSGGLVWVISGKFLAGGGTKLYGLIPSTGVPRYTETLPSPVVDHFASPSAAGGRVFLATGSSVTAYQIAQLKTPPNPPSVVTEQASSVTQTTATLNASVNPNGGAVSECRFEYGTATAYTHTARCASQPGSGTSAVAVSASVVALAANTVYHFRIVATTSGGTSDGSDETLKTLSSPPSVPTGAASSVTQSSATLAPQGPGNQGVLAFHEQKSPVPDATLLSTSLTASSSGTVNVKVNCPAGQRHCTGTVTLRTLNAVTAGHRSGKKATILTLAVGSFNLAGGRETTVKLHLSAKARKLLARVHVLRVRATIVTHDPAGATHTTQTVVKLRTKTVVRRSTG